MTIGPGTRASIELTELQAEGECMDKREQAIRQMVREEFEAWEKVKYRGMEIENRDEHSMFVNAWATRTYLANYERDRRGQEVARLQERIHRQRVANRKMLQGIKELEADRDYHRQRGDDWRSALHGTQDEQSEIRGGLEHRIAELEKEVERLSCELVKARDEIRWLTP